jgi:transcriptional regulator with XRE-family HTH domain
MTALGQRIKAFRAERALQQRQLAEKAGLTPSMLSQIESGRLTPSLPTLGKLAAALGVSIGALFEPAPAARRTTRWCPSTAPASGGTCWAPGSSRVRSGP